MSFCIIFGKNINVSVSSSTVKLEVPKGIVVQGQSNLCLSHISSYNSFLAIRAGSLSFGCDRLKIFQVCIYVLMGVISVRIKFKDMHTCPVLPTDVQRTCWIALTLKTFLTHVQHTVLGLCVYLAILVPQTTRCVCPILY